MNKGAIAFWIGLALVGSVAYGSWVAIRNASDKPQRTRTKSPANHGAPHGSPSSEKTSVDAEPGPTIKPFELTERTGQPFKSEELKGDVWVASFFFANCPGPCWQLNQTLRGVQDAIKDPDFRIVSITCDPEQDTPEELRKYADKLGADRGRWVFLTGNMEYIANIGREVFKQVVGPGIHMNSALLIDREGRIRGSYDLLDVKKVSELKSEIEKLLKEKPEPEKGRKGEGEKGSA
jgi:cytochrome oxidase Cu insertion factor (SCO1/SenC/PrrC family)